VFISSVTIAPPYPHHSPFRSADIRRSSSNITDSQDVNIENHIDITVVFPDSALPEKTTGGFTNQEEFRAYVHEHQNNGSWNSQSHLRPTSERLADYHGNNIVLAFPLNFPYGHSGLPDDPAVMSIRQLQGKKKHLQRNNQGVLKKLLQHRNPVFHKSLFNLIVANVIMKELIFRSCRLMCSSTRMNGQALAETIAGMTSDQLRRAIEATRSNHNSQYSSLPGAEYLKTIEASCRSLAHTNEASLEARKVYFSYLMKYGTPAVFLTVTPDDERSFRIVAYSTAKVEMQWGSIDVANLSPEDILADFNIRQQARTDYPGLCAEEYRRIMDAVIKHVFQWDEDARKPSGVGLFGELLAWCLATEEQGRKTLHGHFLLFIKDWSTFLERLQTNPNDSRDIKQMTTYFDNVCSAKMFQDFKPPTGTLGSISVYDHCCTEGGDNVTDGTRKRKHRRVTPTPVSHQDLREMRHHKRCIGHNGKIATCPNPQCSHVYHLNDIMTNVLQHHLDPRIEYSSKDRLLDKYVYEFQKDQQWYKNSSQKEIDLRYFAANAKVNLHNVTHANRCFKGGKKECYANLPEQSFSRTLLDFETVPDDWCDALGNETKRYMFRIYPQRGSEDAFVNSHNRELTLVLMCNTNVMCGLTGAAVYYVTGYNAKKNQKEEREAYEKIQAIVVEAIKQQEVRTRYTELLCCNRMHYYTSF
jgi:hypothetical protein